MDENLLEKLKKTRRERKRSKKVIETEKKESKEKALSTELDFLLKGGLEEDYVYKPMEVPDIETEEVSFYLEEPDPGTTCVKYYYPDPEDFEKYNLPCSRRPWPGGREKFDNAMYYRTGDLHNYMQKHYLDHFKEKNVESPFTYQRTNIQQSVEDVCNGEFKLQPHQKFVGAHMSNLTDFGGLLLYHSLGSGKSISSIIVAESNKGYFFDKDRKLEKRQGLEIPQKVVGKDSVREGACHITVIVPKQTINQYLDEIRGNIENGVFKAATGLCVIYSEDLEKEDLEKDEDDYMFFRQFYTGEINKVTKEPYSPDLETLKKYENELSRLDKDRYEAKRRDIEGYEDAQEQEAQIVEQINYVEKQRKILIKKMDSEIKNVYFIMSHEKFLNAITTKKEGKKSEYIASDYILGLSYTKEQQKILPHPDCFHSKKSLLIIDEVQKVTSEGGTNYFRLYDTLQMHARDPLTGAPRMKVVLLTATPVFDNPHEASLMINFQRPRIPFPLDRLTFDNFFIDRTDKDNVKIKNKICYQYLNSGYISFSQGANPKGFPMRRNITQLHKMKSEQLRGYVDALKFDIQKDVEEEEKMKKTKGKTDFLDKIYKIGETDDNQQGRYQWSRSHCNISFPKSDLRQQKSAKKGKKVNPGKVELENFVTIMRNKVSRSNKDFLKAYEGYSSKFAFILKKILESAKKQEGPIIVYCEWVYYGILAMTEALQLMSWDFLRNVDLSPENIAKSNKARNQKMFTIWSGEGLGYMGLRSPNERDRYTARMRNLFNSKANKNGDVVKVAFITVTEGVSFKRVSQLHITSPWWNESRIEQAVGRGIRFRSHCDLPIERQCVDVYYHCSVLPSFPEKDVDVARKISRAIYKNNPNRAPKDGVNFKNLARLTIEQKVFITSRRKTDINKQFENALKETAVDNKLNEYGNLVRFEEILNPMMNIDGMRDYKVLYNRTSNKYFLYKDDKLYNLKINKTVKFKGDKVDAIWPSLDAEVGNKEVDVNQWKQHEIKKIPYKNGELVSYIITEDTKNFNNNPQTRDKNFKELMKYAVKEKGEELKVWNHFEDVRVKAKLFEMLLATYGLVEGRGGEQLTKNFEKRILKRGHQKVSISDKTVRGIATPYLMAELVEVAEKSGDKEMKNIVKEVEFPKVQKKSETEVNKTKKRLTSLFFNTEDSSDQKMREQLMKKYGYPMSIVNNLSPSEVEEIYIDLTIKERN